MKKLFLPLFVCLMLTASAQTKVVHFKKLQAFLPTIEVNDMVREKPTGTTQTALGISTSDAGVEYRVKMDERTGEYLGGIYYAVAVRISDAAFNPYAILQFSMLQQNYESETDDGYEKYISVKNTYPGKLTITSGDYKSVEISFGVGNRYLVNCKLDGLDDIAKLNRFIDAMDLEGLSRLLPE